VKEASAEPAGLYAGRRRGLTIHATTRHSRVALLACLWVAVFLTAGAAAGEERSSLGQMVREALRNNPEIVAAQKRYEAARQVPAQAGALPDPMLSLGYASTGSPRPFAGLGTDPVANAGAMFSQEFPFPGKRGLRSGIATKESQAEFDQYQQVQLTVLARLKQAYFQRQRDYASIATLERNRDLLRKFLRISEARYSVGQTPQQDIFKAQTQISILETRLARLEQDRESRAAEIRSILNRAPDAPLPPPEEARPKPLAHTLEELTAQARENSPVLSRDQRMIERAQLAADLARKEYYPDFTLSGGYFNMGRMPDMYEFRVDFKLPLYFWKKQRAGVAQRAQEVTAARRALEATSQDLAFRIKDDYLMAQTSFRLMELYGKTVIPQASLALESSLASYQTGAADFLTVLTNFMTIIEYELNYQEETAGYQQALSRLEAMTGTPLVGNE